MKFKDNCIYIYIYIEYICRFKVVFNKRNVLKSNQCVYIRERHNTTKAKVESF